MDQITLLLQSVHEEERTKLASASAYAEQIGTMNRASLEKVANAPMSKEANPLGFLAKGFGNLRNLIKTPMAVSKATGWANAVNAGNKSLALPTNASLMLQRAAKGIAPMTASGTKYTGGMALSNMLKQRLNALTTTWKQAPGPMTAIKDILTKSNPELSALGVTGLGAFGAAKGLKALRKKDPEEQGY